MVALLYGCADTSSPHDAPATSASMPASAGLAGAASMAVDDPPGTNTCTLLGAAVAQGTLMDAGVVDAVAAAAGTADAPVADAAHRLATAYAAAVAAHGADGEPDAIAAVSAAATDMSGVCADSGLRSAG
jgi:hypothetical protein